jgi:predicted DCC family thiol-disulfide oxidoreductase YuxK
VTPILLFDAECHVCRVLAHWVEHSAERQSGPPRIVVQGIGQDPAALRLLNPDLDIWEAYAAPHVLMPDGSMSRAGYAVAEVLRRLPNTRWFAGIFAVRVFGAQPFQCMLNAGYLVLADIRPLLGCESCGRPSPWVKALIWIVDRARSLAGRAQHATHAAHFTPVPRSAPATARRAVGK